MFVFVYYFVLVFGCKITTFSGTDKIFLQKIAVLTFVKKIKRA